jgi:hypothetical protein
MRSASAAEAGASHMAATNVHATSDAWRAAKVASSDMAPTADMRCSAVTSAASLRRRCVGAAGQNRHQTESDQRAELCHGKLTGCASAPKRAAPQIPKTDNARARRGFQTRAVPDA